MAKIVRLRFTGRAEEFFEELRRTEGLTEREIIAKGLWLLERAWVRGNVAEVDADGTVRYIFSIKTVPVEPAAAYPA